MTAVSPFLAAWADRCAGSIALDDLPALALARSVKMPETHPYRAGALSLRLRDLVITGADRLDAARCSVSDDGSRVTLSLAPLALAGRYEIMVKPDPVAPIDAAGGLMDLTDAQRAPIAAGQDPTDPPLDPQKEEWLDTAREQRVKLASTPNGQALLGQYSEHNDVFQEVMSDPSVATSWQADGATKAMAADTHGAVQEGSTDVINSGTKTYAGGVTYNGNAFAQQITVAMGCLMLDPSTEGGDKQPASDSRYWAAAKATLAFGKGVNTNTGNSKSNVNEMQASHVYGTVDAHSGDAPEVSDHEAWNILSSGDGGGGRDAVSEPGWLVLDEEDRARMLRLKNDILRRRAIDATVQGTVLFAGACSAEIAGVSIVLERVREGGSVRAAVDLPAFDLDIDDGAWTADAGIIARQRLNRIQFIRTLLREALVDGLDRTACAVAAAIVDTTSLPA